MNRRELLRKAGQAALLPVALAAGSAAEAHPPFPPPRGGATLLYRLRPCAVGQPPRTKCSCNACIKHSTFKYFATAQAANYYRAHLHCNCEVVSEPVSVADYIALFRPNTPGARLVYDSRRG